MISILSHWGRRRAPRWCQFRPRQGGKLKNQRKVRRHRLFGPPRSSLRDTLRRTRYLVTRILFMFRYESFTSVSLSNVFLLSGSLNGFLIFVTERERGIEKVGSVTTVFEPCIVFQFDRTTMVWSESLVCSCFVYGLVIVTLLSFFVI